MVATGVPWDGNCKVLTTLPAVNGPAMSEIRKFALRSFALFLAVYVVVAASGCAGQDGREMFSNGIGQTPTQPEVSTTVAGTSSLPEGTIPVELVRPEMDPELGDSSRTGDLRPALVYGSIYVDSVSGTVGGVGVYELSYPQLDGLSIGHPINALLRRSAEEVRAEFVATLSERSGEEVVDGEGDSLRGGGKVYLLDDRLVSVIYEMQIEWVDAADLDQRVDSVLIDLATGVEWGLQDLFVQESPWLETIGFFARRDLESRLGEGVLWPDGRGLKPEASNFNVFGVTTTGLVLQFPMHSVAPGALGTPVVEVPWVSLAGLVDPAGPVGHLAG